MEADLLKPVCLDATGEDVVGTKGAVRDCPVIVVDHDLEWAHYESAFAVLTSTRLTIDVPGQSFAIDLQCCTSFVLAVNKAGSVLLVRPEDLDVDEDETVPYLLVAFS